MLKKERNCTCRSCAPNPAAAIQNSRNNLVLMLAVLTTAAQRHAEVPVVATDAGQAIFKCPEASVPV
eukprot:3542882-Pleurochrysis_carterae.AAC.1